VTLPCLFESIILARNYIDGVLHFCIGQSVLKAFLTGLRSHVMNSFFFLPADAIGLPFSRIWLYPLTNSSLNCRVSRELTAIKIGQGNIGMKESR
jgi:hypothetical protein